MKISRELKYFFSLSALLGWDAQTYLPPKGVAFRAQQSAFIEEKVTAIMTGDDTKSLMEKLSNHVSELDFVQLRNYSLFKKEYERRASIPKELLIDNIKQQSLTFSVWQEAKHKQDFKLYAPELAKNIANKQKMASYMDANKIPFDVYLDNYEPGFTSEKISLLFNQLKPKIISLLQKIQQSSSTERDHSVDFSMPQAEQQVLVRAITRFIGFDLEKGSIDRGEHPMTNQIGTPDDVRITVNYNEKNVLTALFAGLHEAGHAIHGQNVNTEYIYQPIGLFGRSAGISESQSRFFENLIGRSAPFWSYYSSKMPKSIQKIGLDDFVSIINKVQLSKIRIEADELTYPLHIIVRFEIEKGLLDGSIEVDELPAIWNEKMQDYFGLEISNDSEGVMQDIHWATSFYGYFPTYALGNIYNAQMYYTMKQEVDFDSFLANGSIKPIRNWLRDNVHKKTGLYDPEDFVKIITHEHINPDYFINYLEEKFSQLYGLR